jgi:hypothetical protein
MRYTVEFKYRFELLVPLADNRGKPFRPAKIDKVRDQLVEAFGGCQALPLPYTGTWRHEGLLYHEELMLFVVDTPRSDESLDWFLTYKRRLKRQFKQVEIYLTVSEVLWL